MTATVQPPGLVRTSGAVQPARPVVARPADDDIVRWGRCPGCGVLVYLKRLDNNLKVCPECGHHHRLTVPERLTQLLDPGSFSPRDTDLAAVDVLGFTDSKPYPQRLAAARRATGTNDAVTWGSATVQGYPLVVAALDFRFMGGSIGAVAGELICRAARHAIENRTPLLIISASGGARMQEGAIALMQLARTSQEIARLHEAGVLCLNLNTDPTYGGATASFSVLGDVLLAEPGARIGFAGAGVIKQTIRQDLPPGFQTAEFLHENGLLDLVTPREMLRPVLARLLRLHSAADRPAPDAPRPVEEPFDEEPGPLTAIPVTRSRTAAETVALARDIGRPTTLELIGLLCDDFVELHGDGAYADDPAVVGGPAEFAGRTVVVVGHQKGHETAELVRRNFGMPQPAGYHKVERLMAYAAKFGLPLISFIDTPGAYPGLEAEQRGQGHAIARCLMRAARLPVPAVAVVTGEGGSGGALALGVADRLLMMENAYFSVISPEGCSTILWGTAAQAARAAEALRIRPDQLMELGVVDGIVPEPAGGAHLDHPRTATAIRAALVQCLDELVPVPSEELIARRYQRYAAMGPRAAEGRSS